MLVISSVACPGAFYVSCLQIDVYMYLGSLNMRFIKIFAYEHMMVTKSRCFIRKFGGISDGGDLRI